MAEAKKNYNAKGSSPWTNAAGEKMETTAGQVVALTDAEYEANKDLFFAPVASEKPTVSATKPDRVTEMDDEDVGETAPRGDPARTRTAAQPTTRPPNPTPPRK